MRRNHVIIIASLPLFLSAQPPLQQQIRKIADDAHGKVTVACSLPQSALNCDLDPHAHPPMQSVFKLPLAISNDPSPTKVTE